MTRNFLLPGLALVLAILGLNLPNSFDELAMPQFWHLPAEVLLALALVIVVGGQVSRHLARLLGFVLAMMILVRVLDRLIWLWFGRELVLATDAELLLPLLEVSTAGWRLLPLAVAVAALASMLVLLAWPLVKGLENARGLPRVAAALPALLASLWFAGGPISAFGIDQFDKQVTRLADARTGQARFATAKLADPWRHAHPDRLFTQLRDVDVLVVFVESYGRSAFDHPGVAPAVRPSLDRLERAAAGAGKILASGYVRSPTLGGQSWLAHATLASGVRTGDQGGWRVYLKEADADIAHLFRRAGHETFMAQPAIVRPFPEAEALGFDRLLFADQLGYRGPKPGYVTMPDQFTLARIEQVLAEPTRRPRYGQIVLIGSHAPFTPPVPDVVPWSEIGDGQVFEGRIEPGLGAAELWSDDALLLDAYADAIARTLDLAASWAALPVGRPRLVLMVGDHEPAARVLGQPPGYDVPLHVLASSPDLVLPFRQAGFVDGARPDPAMRPPGMEALRQMLLHGFSGQPHPKVASTADGRRLQ